MANRRKLSPSVTTNMAEIAERETKKRMKQRREIVKESERTPHKKPKTDIKETKKARLTKEYNKQRKRITNYINRMKKQGYIFPKDILPLKPKRITEASVRRLSKITAKELRNQAQYVDVETGEIISANTRLKQIRREAAAKARATRQAKKNMEAALQQAVTSPSAESAGAARKGRGGQHGNYEIGSDEWLALLSLTHFREILDAMRGAPLEPKVREWFNRMLEEYGEINVGNSLERAAHDGLVLSKYHFYNEKELNYWMEQVINYYPRIDFDYQGLLDALNDSEGWWEGDEDLEDY